MKMMSNRVIIDIMNETIPVAPMITQYLLSPRALSSTTKFTPRKQNLSTDIFSTKNQPSSIDGFETV